MAKSGKKTWPKVQVIAAILFVCLVLGIWVLNKQPPAPQRFGSEVVTDQSTEIKPAGEMKIQRYESKKGDLLISASEAVYVTETFQNEDGLTNGTIVVSVYPGAASENSNFTIQYGIPYIDGKGGACPEIGYKKERILSQTINVCEGALGLHGGYPKNPNQAIEYAFYIGGNDIAIEEFKLYKEILTSLSYLP